MVNEQVIARLKQKNWYATCQNKQESNLVLQACDDAGITWSAGEKATEWCPFGTYPFDICFCNNSHGISADNLNTCEAYEMENITDWFFNAIKKNNDNGKLTPQNAKQEHLVQILLAMSQNIPIEVNISGEWELSTILFPTMNYEYRIKPTLIATPLPISREMWSYLDKRWRYAAMELDGRIFFYNTKPTREPESWSSSSDMSDCPLNINVYGINWETSLTERPEGV